MAELVRPLGTGDPERLGPWRLLGVLGAGGMGTVYLGQAGRRLAAVKTLRPENAGDPHFLARFEREIRAAGAVRNPCIARVYDADLDGRVPWFAGEFVPGPTLERTVTDRGPLPSEAVRVLGALLAHALLALHAAGVVHRDLKPSNVLLTADGVRVVDFGIARVPDATALTLAAQRPGSAGYMSPEQVLGGEIGPPSDVFVLGALLTFASTGHHAFGAHAALVDFAIAHEEPDLTPVPDGLRQVLARCLAKDPALRPTAAELQELWSGGGGRTRAGAALLGRVPARVPADWLPSGVLLDIAARERRAAELAGHPVPGGRPGGRRLPRRRSVLAAAGGSLLLAGAGTAAWRWYADAGTRNDAAATPVPRWTGAPGTQPDPLWEVSGLAPEPPFPPTAAGTLLLAALPGNGVVALDARTGEERWRTENIRTVVTAERPLALDEDGAPVALAPDTGDVRWRGSGGLRTLLAADGDTVYGLDGSGGITAVRTGDGTRRWRRTAPSGTGATAQAALAHGLLLLTGEDGVMHALRTRDGAESWRQDTGTGAALRPAADDDGVYLGGARLRALRPADGERLWELPSQDSAEGAAGFGPPTVRGDHLYAADGDVLRRVARQDPGSGAEFDMGGAWDPFGGRSGPRAGVAPVVAGDGVHLTPADPAAGVLAVRISTMEEQYRFVPPGDPAGAWLVAVVNGIPVMQCGERLFALPPL
ncbi:PQQ-binding-like beta-propeller repeat protein [Streptomyces sp. NPDC017966]|uniref:serine/threonine-protein kinase n=1 Tax=Streptomyces sp. NPDC017966 TaxID=3365023 RepID=UPI0037A6584E